MRMGRPFLLTEGSSRIFPLTLASLGILFYMLFSPSVRIPNPVRSVSYFASYVKSKNIRVCLSSHQLPPIVTFSTLLFLILRNLLLYSSSFLCMITTFDCSCPAWHWELAGGLSSQIIQWSRIMKDLFWNFFLSSSSLEKRKCSYYLCLVFARRWALYVDDVGLSKCFSPYGLWSWEICVPLFMIHRLRPVGLAYLSLKQRADIFEHCSDKYNCSPSSQYSLFKL